MGKNITHVDNLYDSQGIVKRAVKFHPDFLRPLYQYTSSEIRNTQREEKYYGTEYVKDDSYYFSER